MIIVELQALLENIRKHLRELDELIASFNSSIHVDAEMVAAAEDLYKQKDILLREYLKLIPAENNETE